jgi:regulator of cell morphogenesis and NO signaling
MQLITMTLGDLARLTPGAMRVFMRHRLDFCCGGKRTLADACAVAGLDPKAILGEIHTETDGVGDSLDWERRSQAELADHIEQHYHARLRRDLPPLIEAARRVERVHAGHPAVPCGLADVLARFASELEAHMRKEETILFPMLRRGARGNAVYMPVRVMEREHDGHAESLVMIRELTDDLSLPVGACATWTGLYAGLHALAAELVQHIHLENNILFLRATREG